MATIFWAEDDFYLQRDLRLMLEREGHRVFTASGVKEARQRLFSLKDTDLFLLDLWLPDGDGFELLSEIRKKTQAPILFLTACDDEQSVIRGLEAGTDDYITKPFRKAELLSRIRANLRRSNVIQNTSVLVSGGLRLDTSSHEVTSDGERILLRPAEYRLLLFFMENPGLLFSRERLQDVLSEDEPERLAEDNALSVQISRLRKMLPSGMIETVRGFGYRFNAEVKKN